MGDIDKNNLFPVVNPNLDELAQEAKKPINEDEVIVPEGKTQELDNPLKKELPNDIFVKKEKKGKIKLSKNEILDHKDPTDTIVETDVKPKRDYSHLAKARAKAQETRRLKAEERKKKKAEEKERKRLEKEAKKKATAERNKKKALERYYKNKEKKEMERLETAKHIAKEARNPPANMQHYNPPTLQNTGMDFRTFSQYMFKYEQMKEQYRKAKQPKPKSKPIPIPKKQEPKPKAKPFHPEKYPLSNWYNPNNRNKEFSMF